MLTDKLNPDAEIKPEKISERVKRAYHTLIDTVRHKLYNLRYGRDREENIN